MMETPRGAGGCSQAGCDWWCGFAQCLALSRFRSVTKDQGAVANHFNCFSLCSECYEILFLSYMHFFTCRVKSGGWPSL